VATLRDTAHHGRHRADTDCLAWGKDSETQIKPLNEIEKRKELDGGAAGRGVLLQHEKRPSANQGGGDDANVIFGAVGQRVFRIGHTT
jgi:hypothetical protein